MKECINLQEAAFLLSKQQNSDFVYTFCQKGSMHLTQSETELLVLILCPSLGLIMFGGEFLTSFVPEVGVQEQMREHGKDPLWKIKYEQ